MKRAQDIILTVIAIVIFTPVMAIIAIFVHRRLGMPVLFRQSRPGLNGLPFQLVKFRTMRNSFDSAGNTLPDAERLTSFGHFLRASSLDEIPSLWNVLKGDMSLIGPRPLLMEYVPLYTAQQNRRHEVRPGITGWAQVNGRNALSWEEKFALDVWYVDNRSILLDLKIMWMTLLKVVRRDGISAAGEATMPKFTGTVGQ
jgi:lipopolysaccharide/colanic/teichoic acid biosynthesis glycosyltransferase